MNTGVVGHYEFHDASSASRQDIKDSEKNINFIIDFEKEIEVTYSNKSAKKKIAGVYQ